MKKISVALLLIGCIGICSATWAQVEALKQKELLTKQRQERIQYQFKQQEQNLSFRESLSGKSEKEKQALLKQHNEKQKQIQKEFQRKMHEDNMAYLKESLTRNPEVRDTEKKELLNLVEDQFQKSLKNKNSTYIENVIYYEKIFNDPAKTAAQKKNAIKEFIKKQKDKAKSHAKKSAKNATFIPLKSSQPVPGKTVPLTTNPAAKPQPAPDMAAPKTK